MKKCPFCGEEIQSEAIKCRYCGEWLDKKGEASLNKDGLNDKKSTPPGLSSKQSTVATNAKEKNKQKPFINWKSSIIALVIAAFGNGFLEYAFGLKYEVYRVFWDWMWISLMIEGWKYWKWKALLLYPIVIFVQVLVIVFLGYVNSGRAIFGPVAIVGVMWGLNMVGLIICYGLLSKLRKENIGETATLKQSEPLKMSGADSIDWQIKLQVIWNDYWAYFIIVPIIIIVAGIIFTLAQKPNLNKSAEQGTESESAKLINPWANPDGTLNAEGRKQMDQLNRDFRNTGEAQLSKANKAIHLNPNDADAYLKRGSAYTILHQPQRAIEDYNEAIRLKPDAETYSNRGFFYSIIGQYKLAIEDYNEVILLKPDSADGYGGRGFVYGQLGDNELRCRDLKKACALGECKQLETSKENGFCR